MADGTAMLTGFDHVTVVVRSLGPAIDAYGALLGAVTRYRGVYPDLGSESALFGVENGLVELVAPVPGDDRGDGLRMHLEGVGEGLHALAFATADAAAASACLRAQGVRATPPQEGSARDQSGRQRTFTTVELSPRATRGIAVLLVERDAADALRGSGWPDDSASAIDHVVLRTADIAAAKALYGDALGLRLALEKDVGGTPMLFFRHGGVTLEVLGDPSVGDSDQLWGIAYRVRNMAAARRRLLAGGVELSSERDGNKSGTRVCTVYSHQTGVPTLLIQDPSRR